MKKKHEIELITLKVFWILNKAARNIHLTSHKKGALTLDFFDCAGAYCYIDMENKTKRKKLSSSQNYFYLKITICVDEKKMYINSRLLQNW